MLSIFVIVLVRILLVMLFLPFSALDKILNFKQARKQASQAVSATSIGIVLIFAGFGVEIVMSLAILTGVADRLAAFVLAGYCIVTAMLWKQFWKVADFRLKGDSRGREVFWDFLKNLALAGGFLCWRSAQTRQACRAFLRIHLHPRIPMLLIDKVPHDRKAYRSLLASVDGC